MDTTQELIKQVEELKIAAWRNAKPIFDEQITRCVSAIIVDMLDGTILYSTQPANDLFGYTNGGLDGKNITDLMPERFRKAHGGHLQHFAHNPKPRQMGEAQMDLYGISAKGEEFKIEISLYPTEIINKKCAVATIIKMRK
jgi:PAS domain S-box-containing protein